MAKTKAIAPIKQSILFTFNSMSEYDEFMKHMQASDSPIIAEAIKQAKQNPSVLTNEQKLCQLYVGGNKIIEGQFPDINRRFMQEVSTHSASVVMKQFKNNEWVVIKKRSLQNTTQ